MITKMFVDGSNLFGGIGDVLPPGEYFHFSDLVAEIRKDFRIDVIHFYGTYMNESMFTAPSDKLKAKAQVEFFNDVRKDKNILFYSGYFSGKNKEKGVDVHLAVDMVLGSMKNEFDNAVVMTGDDDLIYPVQILRSLHKKVHLTAFGARFPFGISFNTDMCYLYDYQKYFQNNVLPKFHRVPRKLVIRQLGKLPVYKAK